MSEPVSFERYSRQILYAAIGQAGQERISASSVVVVGCGALGSVSASLMARAGVGRLRIIDRDFVDLSNLQRQLLFDEDDVREMKPKAVAAAEKLSRVNSSIAIESVVSDVNPDNIVDLVRGFALILDGTDNFETRFLINDVSIRHDIPWIYAACLGSYGLTMNILPGETACLRCVMESPPPPGSVATCDTAGILGPVVSMISSLQSTEALKLLSGNREAMSRDLVSLDGWTQVMTRVEVPRSGGRRRCEACDGMEFSYLSGRGSRSVVICGRNAVQVTPEARSALSLEDLASRLPGSVAVKSTRFMVRFDVDDLQVAVFPDGRAIITGTRDPAVARGVYARYVGA
ncbi:MAG TPA: ThiF family adenylyltransferase [Patescibacteria group bacterium]|jgi:adenylyltransferase/sulfurtransferase|nr:ThiF family adenylyltransferase [Patescibacteria group bacterium]